MGRNFFVISFVVFGVIFSASVSALNNNPNVQSPVGSATVPPSSYQSGLVTSPNPMQRSGNLVVTGNVGGGKHFRGVVPYNAITDFSGRIGSSTLDSFLRRSHNPMGFGNYSGGVTPYYSQTRTVTSIGQGTGNIFRPSASKLTTFAPSMADVPKVPKKFDLDIGMALLNIRLRPLSFTSQELEQLISIEAKKRLQSKASDKYEQTMERFQEELEQVDKKASDLERRFAGQEKLQELAVGLEPMKTQELEVQAERFDKVDVYERMKQSIEMSQETLERVEADKQEEPEEKQLEEEPGRITETEKEKPLEGFSREQISVQAETILGEYKSFASFADDKFNRYMRAAEQYLKEGKYYRAADVYALASIYKPRDPLVYAGKSHALFAAGEYMSSALFLVRTLEIFPEYAWFKIDIEGMVGDKDKLESRVVDIREWQEKNKSAELQFLLSYVYYQMGRVDMAKESIDGAYEKMPSSAVIALRSAIHSRTSVNQLVPDN